MGEPNRSQGVFQQGIRYLVVGFSSAAIELALYYVLHQVFGIHVVASNVIALSAATTYNFIMSRKWTFQSTSNLPRSIVLYLLLFAWNQLFSSSGIVWLISMGVHFMLAKVITIGIIVSWNFILYRTVVFK